MSLFLTSAEVAELTGRTRRDAQARALRAMGIDFKARPDGSAAVLRAVVEKALGAGVTSTTRKDKGPRFELAR